MLVGISSLIQGLPPIVLRPEDSVYINGEFLHRIHLTIVIPTEHIDISCELAAAVALSWLLHLLHLLPKVSVNVIPMTVD